MLKRRTTGQSLAQILLAERQLQTKTKHSFQKSKDRFCVAAQATSVHLVLFRLRKKQRDNLAIADFKEYSQARTRYVSSSRRLFHAAVPLLFQRSTGHLWAWLGLAAILHSLAVRGIAHSHLLIRVHRTYIG